MTDTTLAVDLAHVTAHCDITAPRVEALVEAARVMLARYHSAPPPPTGGEVVTEASVTPLSLTWAAPTPAMVDTNANVNDATEEAAYAISFGVLGAKDGWRVVKRAQHASGADFILLKEGESEETFARLEVSGVAARDEGELRRRLARKVAQLLRAGRDHGVAAVVGIEATKVLLQEVRP